MIFAASLPAPSQKRGFFRSGDASRLFPGAVVDGFPEAWGAALEQLPPGKKHRPGNEDRLHVESHLLDGRDVFITDDKPVLKMCALLATAGWKIDAVGLVDYFKRRDSACTHGQRGG